MSCLTLAFLAGGSTGSALVTATAESVVSPLLSASATVFFFTGAFLFGMICITTLHYLFSLIVGLSKDGCKHGDQLGRV